MNRLALPQTRNLQYLLLAAITVLSMGTALVAAPSAAAATSGGGCHKFQPDTEPGELFGITQGIAQVPSRSACRDINISDITDTNPESRGTHCGQFWVNLYPRSGGVIPTPTKRICSQPGAKAKVLVTNVLNGTRYQVFYLPDYPFQHLQFKVMD